MADFERGKKMYEERRKVKGKERKGKEMRGKEKERGKGNGMLWLNDMECSSNRKGLVVVF